jgi:hypothetical protein
MTEKDCPAQLVLTAMRDGVQVADIWYCTVMTKHIVHRADGVEPLPCFHWSSFEIDTSK